MDERLNERDLMAVDGLAKTRLATSPAAAADGMPVPGSVLSAQEHEQLTADVVAALKAVYDPEIPADPSWSSSAGPAAARFPWQSHGTYNSRT
jgi:hypothetical protein